MRRIPLCSFWVALIWFPLLMLNNFWTISQNYFTAWTFPWYFQLYLYCAAFLSRHTSTITMDWWGLWIYWATFVSMIFHQRNKIKILLTDYVTDSFYAYVIAVRLKTELIVEQGKKINHKLFPCVFLLNFADEISFCAMHVMLLFFGLYSADFCVRFFVMLYALPTLVLQIETQKINHNVELLLFNGKLCYL